MKHLENRFTKLSFATLVDKYKKPSNYIYNSKFNIHFWRLLLPFASRQLQQDEEINFDEIKLASRFR